MVQHLREPGEAQESVHRVEVCATRYLEWFKGKEDDAGCRYDFFDADMMWHYIKDLCSEGAGRFTPKSCVHALQFFADAFGVRFEASDYKRVRKVAEQYSRSEKPPAKAPMFPVQTLRYLEDVTTSMGFPLNKRIVAGKLRLCIQAALRWDDLTRTPLGNLEWVGVKGDVAIRGLRTKVAGSKSGNRPCMASYLGSCAKNDDWLPTLVRLLQEVHGEGWMLHDHVGKSFSRDGRHPTASIPEFNQDVGTLRDLLVEAIEDGHDIGLTVDEARRARWHGAKSTITSIMMHLELGERAVRFSGNWKSLADSMPDRYLREAQLLVLKAQESALNYIRAGGDLGVLEGIPLARGRDEKDLERKQPDKAREDALKQAASAAVPGLAPTDVAPETASREGSLGAMAAVDGLESEKGDMDGYEEYQSALDEQPVADEDGSTDLSTGETTGSETESYLTHFVQMSRAGTILHRPRGSEDEKAWCGTQRKAPGRILVGEALGRKTSFCSKCFGVAKRCGKLCVHTKVVTMDGEKVQVRCMRRCDLGCSELGKYLDGDTRRHLCEAHADKGQGEK